MSRNSISRYLLPGTGVILALAGWWLVAELAWVSAYYLPPPRAVFALLLSCDFATLAGQHLALTLGRGCAGYVLAAIIGVPIGLGIGRSRAFASFVAPIVEFLRPLPSSAIIPIALLFLGLGSPMHVAVIAFGCTWPILVATVEGARAVEPSLQDVARLLGLARWDRVVSLHLPSAAPFIATGLRTSLAVALILAVTAEMIAGGDGIGFLILDMERAFRTPEMYAAILVLGGAGCALNAAFIRCQRRLIYWRP